MIFSSLLLRQEENARQCNEEPWYVSVRKGVFPSGNQQSGRPVRGDGTRS